VRGVPALHACSDIFGFRGRKAEAAVDIGIHQQWLVLRVGKVTVGEEDDDGMRWWGVVVEGMCRGNSNESRSDIRHWSAKEENEENEAMKSCCYKVKVALQQT
jgi:hypothetical protein